jgi:hypothetical protein
MDFKVTPAKPDTVSEDSSSSNEPEASPAVALADRRFVFLCGVPRSGTTAFADLMNRHEKIAVGVERFKSLTMNGATNELFGPDLFEKQRFFDFRPTDTNVRADDIYRRMQERFDSVQWVGDKVPRYYTKLPAIYERFPDPVVFYIVRDIRSVANSWNIRAHNEKDHWPRENDYKAAVVEWNKGNVTALRWVRKQPENFHVIAYDDLFPRGIDLVGAILDRLNLTFTPDFLKQYKAFMEAPRRPSGERVEYPGQDEFLEANADMATYKNLLKRRLKT